MERTWAIATAVVADAARRKLVYVVVLFAVLMAAAIPMLPSYGQGVVEAVEGLLNPEVTGGILDL